MVRILLSTPIIEAWPGAVEGPAASSFDTYLGKHDRTSASGERYRLRPVAIGWSRPQSDNGTAEVFVASHPTPTSQPCPLCRCVSKLPFGFKAFATRPCCRSFWSSHSA